MINVQLLNQQGEINIGGEELLESYEQQPDSKIWVDMTLTDSAQTEQWLVKLGCDPLAIKDTLRERHPPKLEIFDQHIFILYRGVLSTAGHLDIEHLQLAFFVSERMLITVRHGFSQGLQQVWTSPVSALLRGPLYTAIRVMHTSAGIYLEKVLQFENKLSDMEDAFIQHGNDQMMAELVSYRSKLVKLRRVFNYHNAISAGLHTERENRSPLIHDTNVHDIIDLKDRFERLTSLVQMHYEICGDLLDGYLSISSHQLNVTMRVLTVITAVFVPLSFLAGLYGMNFESMPELKWHYGYPILLAIMVSVAGGLLFFFKKRKWI